METTRDLEDSGDGDIEGDPADENENENENNHDNEDDNGGDGDTDEDAEVIDFEGTRYETECSERVSYFCPDKKCKGRKADKTLKQYIRHYDIHVPCQVPCAGCPTISHNVAALKRHFGECPELKQKRHLPEYERRFSQMKRRRATESAKASTMARNTLGAHKRRLSNRDRSRPRKRARLARRSELSSQSTEESSQHHTVIESSTTSPTSSSLEDPPEQCDTAWTAKENNNLSLISISNNVNSLTDGQFPYPPIARFSAPNIIMGTGALELADSTAMFPLDQQSTAQNVTALAGASKNHAKMTDESATTAQSHMFPSPDSAMVTEALSFGSYTMDGSAMDVTGLQPSSCSHLGASSIYFADAQHSKNDSAPTQASSFVSHTMDGSATHTTDQVYTDDLQLWGFRGYSI